MKNKDLLEKTLNICTLITFTALIIVVLLQVISRFIPIAFVWTEELSRFLFIYSVAFAAPLAMKKKEYVNVDLLVNLIPEKIRNLYEMVIYIMIAIFMLIVMYEGISYIQIGMMQTSATMTIPMSIPHASMSIMALFISVYAIVNAINFLKDHKNRGAEQ